MKIGIIGLPLVGKTTLFNLLTSAKTATSQFFSGRTESNVGTATVPDRRIDYLASVYHPRRTIYASIEFTDVAGLVRGAASGAGVGNQFLNDIRQVDALVHVVRLFQDSDVPHVEGSLDAMRDLDTVDTELVFADLELVEKRLERIRAAKKVTIAQQEEKGILEKCRSALEAGQPLHAVEFGPEEKSALRPYGFLTEKPMVLVANLDEEQLSKHDYPQRADLQKWAEEHGVPLVEVCAKMEVEIAELPPEERVPFLAELGLEEPGVARLARAVYKRLGLISFFTVGEDEVKAWTIRAGTPAKQAAGKIHTDIERGFIRAEVVAFDDFAAAGNMAGARDQGKVRLEGKDYIVADGDIINFRFNV